jgi:hypothetical protein
VPEPLEEYAWHGDQPAESTDLATDANLDLRTLDDPKP